jgi:predicted metallopeptidase
MPIKYEAAEDVDGLMREICMLMFPHVKLDSVSCIRSHGSQSRGTIARCHALGKAMQLGMNRKIGFYVIEVISKTFDRQSEEDKIKTIIHEIMHIPKSFGGGFRHHDYVCDENVEVEYQRYVNLKKRDGGLSGLSGFDGKVNVNDTDVDERTSGDEGNKVVEKKKQYWW